MNKIEYYRLRSLPENKDLSETEFQMKYINKRDVGYNFNQTNTIDNIAEFKAKMRDIKFTVEKQSVEW